MLEEVQDSVVIPPSNGISQTNQFMGGVAFQEGEQSVCLAVYVGDDKCRHRLSSQTKASLIGQLGLFGGTGFKINFEELLVGRDFKDRAFQSG